ncbi:ATP synthase F1 subunit delta [Rhodohalobacter sp. 8-1]|uniref:ATP synthase F1 subunit delta n=1 Tax=Rhodohalobacter sp. 8-1 TaxID=3131972 RepID=UPI0030EC7619
MISKAARRYANALLQSALEQDILDDVEKDIRFILNTVQDSRDLVVFLKSPIIKTEDKQDVLSTIFHEHISGETKSLLRLLSEKNRENLLEDICQGFIQLYNKHEGIIQVDVTTAYELSKSQTDDLLKALASSTGKKIEMNVTVDEDIIGGLIVRIDDTVLDGSVKHKIRKLKNQFAVGTAV